MYAEVFERLDALDKLEAFAYNYGPDFYRLPRNTDTVTLRREAVAVPEEIPLGDTCLRPLRGGAEVNWRVLEQGA